ncbi:mannose-1-phosphate guanylyltransferase/mannose-6-phosphate isomerase [Hellea balneolensis]|uniref:mannose-1-phosphate guanylyltransferase/mannose-6-phosphate isomerase n=1 Tax=Hellea balneolensis TaxID=287478 RepID=UPI0003F5A467|nr:mannose-1-phosphate guanylyltransferase/mannose-6-phosphate isomerase [Hellea balneolensis]
MMRDVKIIPVIMSGGAGSRLWPASRQAMPKQLLPLVTEQTMVQETAERLSGDLFHPPVFICNAAHAEPIRTQMAAIDMAIGAIIVEPMGRNTAPCAVIAALHAKISDPKALILLAPADHHVTKPDAFRRSVAAAMTAAKNGNLVTFGITPDGPETGYGYIEQGDPLSPGAFEVNAFKEKPDRETAQSYLDKGGYFWNAGIFLFSPETLLTEMRKFHPEIVKQASLAYGHAGLVSGQVNLDEESFAACPSESIDYAVMEPTDKAAIVPANIGWNDIGSFTSLHALKKGEEGNAVKGDVIAYNTQNSLIETDGPLVTTVGIDGLAVIVKDGSILVAKLDAAQDVKKIVETLKAEKRNDKL